MKTILGAAVLCGALLTPASASAGTTVHFLTEDSGRFSYVEDGEIKGILVDLVREVARRADIDATFDLLPWKRAYEGALGNADTCVFATTMTEERRPLFKWVAPLVFNNWALLGLKSRHIRLTRLDEARPYVIGVYQGDARETFLRQRGFSLAPVSRNEFNISGLESGRIDLWASSIYTPLQMGPDVAAKIETVLEFHAVELGVACNIAVPDATIERLNRVMAQVRAEHGYNQGDSADEAN
ncbi:MAG TPA: ABC transporter substrate-binding protein [Aliidongia sp.]|uniref:substrate-binding periplasmic protein n=1 Tax=Aliidongia sp. TaxID=1914230 RepID=UPI002DDD6FE4|nr:ABC transporter substrate-binding protein [Aliidongia sp.]HEV2674868.1 ABC transporter substrate-binding protein [Aliidongia sp.]